MRTMVTLFADEGKVLTNGTEYGTTISLAEGADASVYHEITQEEYDEIMNDNLEANMTA